MTASVAQAVSPPWRVAVTAETEAASLYADALMDLVDTLSLVEADEGRAWMVEGLCRDRPVCAGRLRSRSPPPAPSPGRTRHSSAPSGSGSPRRRSAPGSARVCSAPSRR